MYKENKQVVEKINEAFDKSDTETFLFYCIDDVRWNMIGDFDIRGKEAIKDFMAKMPQDPPRFTVTDTIAEADIVMSRGNMIMKNKEGYDEDYAFCDVYKFKDGKVAMLNTYMIKLKAAKVLDKT